MQYKDIYKKASEEADRRIKSGDYKEVDNFDEKADFETEGLIRRPKRKSSDTEEEYDFLMEYFLNLRASFQDKKSFMPDAEDSDKAKKEGKKASRKVQEELEEIREDSGEEEDLDV